MPDSWLIFDRLADGYDEVIPFFAEYAVRLLGVLDPPAGTRLLDIGAGRGAIALAAAAPQLDVRLMDAGRLDLRDDSYDTATGGFVLHLVADPAQVLAELRRVVRPGGTVALTLPGACDDGGRWDAVSSIISEYEPRAEQTRLPARWLEVPEVLQLAGLADVRTTSIEVHIPLTGPGSFWRFQMSHGFAGFVAALDPADAAELRERVLAELWRMQAGGGIILDRGAVVHLARVPD